MSWMRWQMCWGCRFGRDTLLPVSLSLSCLCVCIYRVIGLTPCPPNVGSRWPWTLAHQSNHPTIDEETSAGRHVHVRLAFSTSCFGTISSQQPRGLVTPLGQNVMARGSRPGQTMDRQHIAWRGSFDGQDLPPRPFSDRLLVACSCRITSSAQLSVVLAHCPLQKGPFALSFILSFVRSL
ncbi:hypothetical protein B0I35DRAFT_274086 [Stachybotrys elegans]|uniref:Uncharacterized protein n=1 Tax=Stachybotrys elegans TaxID=80388 RepID=A0A8K0SNB3_9HYPO|nr:hypothetical protein B0I35DRAFT_274086 [Stachybotrys elegans]